MWTKLVRQEVWIVPAFWIVMALIGAWVNASSQILENARSGINSGAGLVYVDEFTSAAAILVLIPLVHVLIARSGQLSRRLGVLIPVYLTGGVAFSALHVIGMIALRTLIHPLFGQSYEWGPFWPEALYEFRKDALTFVTIVAIIHLWIALKQAHSVALAATSDGAPRDDTQSDRLKFKSGSSTFWISPNEILFAQAAGNYIDLQLSDGSSRLVRMALAAFEKELAGSGLVRVHRSFVLNPKVVSKIETTGGSAYEATLIDGRKIPVSRRMAKDKL